VVAINVLESHNRQSTCWNPTIANLVGRCAANVLESHNCQPGAVNVLSTCWNPTIANLVGRYQRRQAVIEYARKSDNLLYVELAWAGLPTDPIE
jgi:hypothetical protein